MRVSWPPGAVLFLLGLLTLPLNAQSSPTLGRSQGQMFPDFRLPNLEGGWMRLSDLRGQKVLLVNFASW